MAGVDIRDYRGDFEDIVELAHRVWVPEYGGKTWIPLPEAAFLREKFASETGALCLVAYEGASLVGSVFSVPRRMRIAGTDYPVSMFTGFTVEPSHRRVALPLIERLRRISEDNGAAFGLGMVLDDFTSASYRFWTKYAETYPKNFQFVFRGGYWAKFLRPDAFAKAGIKTWERVTSRAVGPLLRLIPRSYDPHVRPYRPSDLERCFELVEKTLSGVDWAMRWSIDQLAAQLEPV
jgi:Acetyltransferase (GNAT) domain